MQIPLYLKYKIYVSYCFDYQLILILHNMIFILNASYYPFEILMISVIKLLLLLCNSSCLIKSYRTWRSFILTDLLMNLFVSWIIVYFNNVYKEQVTLKPQVRKTLIAKLKNGMGQWEWLEKLKEDDNRLQRTRQVQSGAEQREDKRAWIDCMVIHPCCAYTLSYSHTEERRR